MPYYLDGNILAAVLIPIVSIILVWLFSMKASEKMPALYARLKLPFCLPNTFFRNGWIVMYVLFAIAWGYAIYYEGNTSFLLGLFLLILNVVWIWSFVIGEFTLALFFLILEIVIIISLLVFLWLLVASNVLLWIPIILFVVYLVWIGLATYQNVYVALYN